MTKLELLFIREILESTRAFAIKTGTPHNRIDLGIEIINRELEKEDD